MNFTCPRSGVCDAELTLASFFLSAGVESDVVPHVIFQMLEVRLHDLLKSLVALLNLNQFPS